MNGGTAANLGTCSDFWAFSLEFYGREGVAAACLDLQDGYDVDVELLLFALWCAVDGRRLDTATIRDADGAVAGWRETVIRPVRRARVALRQRLAEASPATDVGAGPCFDRTGVAGLRESLRAVELEAERLQQQALERRAPPPDGVDLDDAARDNLACLAAFCGLEPDAAPFDALLGALAKAASGREASRTRPPWA